MAERPGGETDHNISEINAAQPDVSHSTKRALEGLAAVKAQLLAHVPEVMVDQEGAD